MPKILIGQTIKKKRMAKGLSQEELSNLAEISRRYLQEIEAGNKGPSYSVLFDLAKALDTTPAAILKPAWSQYINK